MRQKLTVLASLGFALLATAQTPPGYAPSTNTSLTVTYDNGSLVIQPNELVPIDRTVSQPTLSLPLTSPNAKRYARYARGKRQEEEDEKYMILMLDLSLNATDSCIQPPLPSNITSIAAPGLEVGRTTYLHWFQGNLTLNSNQILTPTSNYTIATYIAPIPNVGDVPHTYVFYLVRQPENFVLPEEDQERQLNLGMIPEDRIGFDIGPIVEEAGGVVAGMYLREQGPSGKEC